MFAKVGRVSVVVVIRTTSPIGMVESAEVVISAITAKNIIASRIQEWGFPTPVSLQEECYF